MADLSKLTDEELMTLIQQKGGQGAAPAAPETSQRADIGSLLRMATQQPSTGVSPTRQGIANVLRVAGGGSPVEIQQPEIDVAQAVRTALGKRVVEAAIPVRETPAETARRERTEQIITEGVVSSEELSDLEDRFGSERLSIVPMGNNQFRVRVSARAPDFFSSIQRKLAEDEEGVEPRQEGEGPAITVPSGAKEKARRLGATNFDSDQRVFVNAQGVVVADENGDPI